MKRDILPFSHVTLWMLLSCALSLSLFGGKYEKLFVLYSFMWMVALDSCFFLHFKIWKFFEVNNSMSAVMLSWYLEWKRKTFVHFIHPIRWFPSFCHRYRSFAPLCIHIGLTWCLTSSSDSASIFWGSKHEVSVSFEFKRSLVIACWIECILMAGCGCCWLRHIRQNLCDEHVCVCS